MDYNVKLERATFILHDESEVSAVDTIDGAMVMRDATNAIRELKRGEIVKIKQDEYTTLVPNHAIVKARTTEETAEQSYEDANCNYVCDCGGGDDDEKQGIKSISISPTITTTPHA